MVGSGIVRVTWRDLAGAWRARDLAGAWCARDLA